jgi:hypothetical protein
MKKCKHYTALSTTMRHQYTAILIFDTNLQQTKKIARIACLFSFHCW